MKTKLYVAPVPQDASLECEHEFGRVNCLVFEREGAAVLQFQSVDVALFVNCMVYYVLRDAVSNVIIDVGSAKLALSQNGESLVASQIIELPLRTGRSISIEFGMQWSDVID